MKPGILFMPHGNLQYSQLPIEKRGWVSRESYAPIFKISEKLNAKIAFEASGETLEIIANETPDVMKLLLAGIKEGRIEPVASPHTHIMMSNVGEEVALNSLIDGLDTWERLTKVRPVTGWNPECSWTSYIPEVFRAAGFEVLIADADSYLLSAFPFIREATGLKYDVRGHSNKNALFKIEAVIKDKPEILQTLFRANQLDNGLKCILRSDMMCNILLWFLMGACEGNRETPIQPEEVKETLTRWRERIPGGNGFIMPYAEDAEYVGTTAYFYVKQFHQARFFEPAPQSVVNFEHALKIAKELNFEFITPSEGAKNWPAIPAKGFDMIDNGCAWHGGTAKAWANTHQARVLDPICTSMWAGLNATAKHLKVSNMRSQADFREIMRNITTAYVSDARWPPAPTSPGRFNVKEALDALDMANDNFEKLMTKNGIADRRALYSPVLLRTQIAGIRDELMAQAYFGETAWVKK